MSGYPAGEALVQSTLVAIAGSVWASAGSKPNVSRGNFLLLNTGNSDHYAIIFPGDGNNQFIAASASERTWQTVIQVWQRYMDDGTSLTNMEALTDAIITQFDKYRKLTDSSGTIVDSNCKTIGKPEEMWNQAGNGPFWLRQMITIEWKEQLNVVFAE